MSSMMSASKNPFKQRAGCSVRKPASTPSPGKKLQLQVQLQCSNFARRPNPFAVFMPKLQAYPAPEYSAETNDPFDSENLHIEWRDITCTWKGLSMAQAEEITLWEECVRHVLEAYAADVIEKSFYSNYPHAAAAPLFERVQLMLDFVRDIGIASFQIDPIRLLDQLVNAFRGRTGTLEGDEWLAGPNDSHQYLASFLTTLDCFAPSAANVAIYTARLNGRLVDDRLVCVQGQMDWYPPRPFFLNLQPTAIENSEYFITPRYKEYRFCSIMDDDSVSCQHVATSDLMPMTWDSELETFRARVGPVSISTALNYTRMTTVAVKHFADGVRFERVMRCRLALEVVPGRLRAPLIDQYNATLETPAVAPSHQVRQLRTPHSAPALSKRSPLTQPRGAAAHSLRIPKHRDVLRVVSQNSHRVQGTAAQVYDYDDEEDPPPLPDTPVLQPHRDVYDVSQSSQMPSQFELQAETSYPKVAEAYGLARQARQQQQAKLDRFTAPEMEWVLRPKATQVRMMTGTTIKHVPETDSLPDYDDGELPLSPRSANCPGSSVAPQSTALDLDLNSWPKPRTSRADSFLRTGLSGQAFENQVHPRSIWQPNTTSREHAAGWGQHQQVSDLRMAAWDRLPLDVPGHASDLSPHPTSAVSTSSPNARKHSVDYILNSGPSNSPLKRSVSKTAAVSPTKHLRRNEALPDLRQAATLGKRYFRNNQHFFDHPTIAEPPHSVSPAHFYPPPYPIPCDEQGRDSIIRLPRPAALKPSNRAETDRSWSFDDDLCPKIRRTPLIATPDNASAIAESDMVGLLSFIDDSSPATSRSLGSPRRRNARRTYLQPSRSAENSSARSTSDPRMSLERLLCQPESHETACRAEGFLERQRLATQPSTRSISSNFSQDVLGILSVQRSRPHAGSSPRNPEDVTASDESHRTEPNLLSTRSASQLNRGLDRILEQRGRNPSDMNWFSTQQRQAAGVKSPLLEDPFLEALGGMRHDHVPVGPGLPQWRRDADMASLAIRATLLEGELLQSNRAENVRHNNLSEGAYWLAHTLNRTPDHGIHDVGREAKDHGLTAGPEKSRVGSDLQADSNTEDLNNEEEGPSVTHRHSKHTSSRSTHQSALRDSFDLFPHLGQRSIDRSRPQHRRSSQAVDDPTDPKGKSNMTRSPSIDMAAAVPDDVEDFQRQIDRRLAAYSAEVEAGSWPLNSPEVSTPSISPAQTPRRTAMSVDEMQAAIQRNFREFQARGLEVPDNRQFSTGSAMSVDDDSTARMERLFLEMESFVDERSD